MSPCDFEKSAAHPRCDPFPFIFRKSEIGDFNFPFRGTPDEAADADEYALFPDEITDPRLLISGLRVMLKFQGIRRTGVLVCGDGFPKQLIPGVDRYELQVGQSGCRHSIVRYAHSARCGRKCTARHLQHFPVRRLESPLSPEPFSVLRDRCDAGTVPFRIELVI